MNIFAHQPMVTPNGQAVCVQFGNRARRLSIALDDSCGRLQSLSRGDIELQRVGLSGMVEVCTQEVFPDQGSSPVHASMENFNLAMEWLNNPDGM
jgi:hypothetical protein